VDPTPYPKRSQWGKKKRQMQFIGRVKVFLKNKQREATRSGYLEGGLRHPLPLMEQLGGRFEVKSVPGAGTTARAIIPLRIQE